MNTAANLLVALIAALHLGFLILEMFLWTHPLGLKVFKVSREQAATTATLAANQGLYNGFLSAGLVLSYFSAEAHTLRIFILWCIVAAGVYGAWTVNRRIFWIQAFPAILALLAIHLTSY